MIVAMTTPDGVRLALFAPQENLMDKMEALALTIAGLLFGCGGTPENKGEATDHEGLAARAITVSPSTAAYMSNVTVSLYDSKIDANTFVWLYCWQGGNNWPGTTGSIFAGALCLEWAVDPAEQCHDGDAFTVQMGPWQSPGDPTQPASCIAEIATYLKNKNAAQILAKTSFTVTP